MNDWGYYNITEVLQTGYTLTDPASGWYSHIYVNGIPVVTQYNFTNDRQNGNISGFKIDDINSNGKWEVGEPGLPLWNITLVNATDYSIIDWNLTAFNGLYSFNNLPAGTYYVNETLKYGWLNTNSSWNLVTIGGSTTEITNLNFTNHLVLGNITGIKFEDKNCDGMYDAPDDAEDLEYESVISGWTVTLYNVTTGGSFVAQTTTDGDGRYNFTGLNTSYTYNVSETVVPGWKNCTPAFSVIDFTDSPACPGIFHVFNDTILLQRPGQ